MFAGLATSHVGGGDLPRHVDGGYALPSGRGRGPRARDDAPRACQVDPRASSARRRRSRRGRGASDFGVRGGFSSADGSFGAPGCGNPRRHTGRNRRPQTLTISATVGSAGVARASRTSRSEGGEESKRGEGRDGREAGETTQPPTARKASGTAASGTDAVAPDGNHRVFRRAVVGAAAVVDSEGFASSVV